MINSTNEEENDSNLVKDYIIQNGFFISEYSFFSKDEFYSDEFKALVHKMIQTIFESKQKYFSVIQSSLLKEENEYLQKLNEAIGALDYLLTLSSEDYSLYYIITKKEANFIRNNLNEFNMIILDLINQINKNEIDNENEEIQKAIDENTKEQERVNRKVLLPLITKCDIRNISSNSVVVTINEITLRSVLQKNRSIEPGFQLKYNNSTISYRLYLYRPDKNDYSIILPQIKDDISNDSNEDILLKGKIVFHLKELLSNHLYMFKLSVVFDNEFISLPKKTFYFHTKALSHKGYCLYGYGSNEHGELVLPTPPVLSQVSLIHKSIIHYSFTHNQTLLALATGEVVNAGLFWSNKEKDDLLFETEYMSNPDIEMNYSDQPFIIHFPIGVFIRQVAVGDKHCLALSNMGECFAWGANTFGQLGLGIEKTLVVGKPQKIVLTYEKELVYISDIQAGFNHNIALGFVGLKLIPFSWGYSQGGEPSAFNQTLGQAIYCSSVPKQLNFIQSEPIISIYAKYNTSAIIVKSKEKGINHLYTFGMNLYDQLGFENAYSVNQKNWDIPTLVNYFSDKEISVLNVSYCERYAAFLTKERRNERNEVYISGTCDFINKTPMKIPQLLKIDSMAENGDIEYACSTIKSLYLTFKNKKIMVIDSTCNSSSSSLVKTQLIPISQNETKDAKVIKMEGMNDNFLLMMKDE